MTSTQDIPEAYWTKIEEFQKKGAISNFNNIIEGLSSFRGNCMEMIQESEQTLNTEEQADNVNRSQHGAQWTILPSASMNVPYRQNLDMYKTKIGQAQAQDEQTKKRFLEQKSELDILAKTKQELLEMMPKSEVGQQVSDMPVSKAIKQALDNIESAKVKREEALTECVQQLTNLNMIDDLMPVHQGQETKEKVFGAKKEEFNVFFKRISEQEDLIKSANNVISTNFADFSKLK